ncbi:hypothetical protein R6Q59_003661 [Mikania micrantha]
MAKFFAILFLALLAISMLQPIVLAKGRHRHGYGSGSLKRSLIVNVFDNNQIIHKNGGLYVRCLDDRFQKSDYMNAPDSVQGDAAERNTINHACFSARNAVQSACVYHRGIMGINKSALATTTGRQRKVDQNAPRFNIGLCS